jgi:hypothetical protein
MSRRTGEQFFASWRTYLHAALTSCECKHSEIKSTISLLYRPHDGMDGLSGKGKCHQHLRRDRQAVLYQMLCRPLSKRKQANDVAFPPSFGGCRVSQSTTPICAIALFRVSSRRAPAEMQRRVRQRQSHGYFIVDDEGHLVRQRTALPGARRCLLTLVGFAVSGRYAFQLQKITP